MGRERIQTRADSDTVEQIENYRDERDISQSEAVRRLIRKGLRTEGLRADAVSSEADVPDDTDSKYTIEHGDTPDDGTIHTARQNGTLRLIGGIAILAFLVLNFALELGVI